MGKRQPRPRGLRSEWMATILRRRDIAIKDALTRATRIASRELSELAEELERAIPRELSAVSRQMLCLHPPERITILFGSILAGVSVGMPFGPVVLEQFLKDHGFKDLKDFRRNIRLLAKAWAPVLEIRVRTVTVQGVEQRLVHVLFWPRGVPRPRKSTHRA